MKVDTRYGCWSCLLFIFVCELFLCFQESGERREEWRKAGLVLCGIPWDSATVGSKDGEQRVPLDFPHQLRSDPICCSHSLTLQKPSSKCKTPLLHHGSKRRYLGEDPVEAFDFFCQHTHRLTGTNMTTVVTVLGNHQEKGTLGVSWHDKKHLHGPPGAQMASLRLIGHQKRCFSWRYFSFITSHWMPMSVKHCKKHLNHYCPIRVLVAAVHDPSKCFTGDSSKVNKIF